MESEVFVPAGQIEPGRFVLLEGEWVSVDMVIATEAPDGSERIWLYFAGRPATVVPKATLLKTRVSVGE